MSNRKVYHAEMIPHRIRVDPGNGTMIVIEGTEWPWQIKEDEDGVHAYSPTVHILRMSRSMAKKLFKRIDCMSERYESEPEAEE